MDLVSQIENKRRALQRELERLAPAVVKKARQHGIDPNPLLDCLRRGVYGEHYQKALTILHELEILNASLPDASLPERDDLEGYDWPHNRMTTRLLLKELAKTQDQRFAAVAERDMEAIGDSAAADIDDEPNPNDDRDAYIYNARTKGVKWNDIRLALEELCKPESKGWYPIDTIPGLSQAAERYAKRHLFPWPIKRLNKH